MCFYAEPVGKRMDAAGRRPLMSSLWAPPVLGIAATSVRLAELPTTTYRSGDLRRVTLPLSMTNLANRAAGISRDRRQWSLPRIVAVTAAALTAGLLAWTGVVGTQSVRAAEQVLAAAAQRSGHRFILGWRLRRWPRPTLAGVDLYVEPGVGAPDIRAVVRALRNGAPRVATDFGLTGHAPWPVVLVSRTTMAAQLHVAPNAAPLGYYQGGVVWLLAPSAFLPPGPASSRLYGRQGPVVHELTHEADSVVSGGTVPRWFDEGVAQYEDWRLTGYVWVQPGDAFEQTVYTWGQLNGRFGALPNQALAYRQALAATAAICRRGPGTCVRVLQRLRAGIGISAAIRSVGGSSLLGRLRDGAFWVAGSGSSLLGPAGPPP